MIKYGLLVVYKKKKKWGETEDVKQTSTKIYNSKSHNAGDQSVEKDICMI